MSVHHAPHLDAFNRDALTNEGYLYTANARLSSRLATQRHVDMILRMVNMSGRTVLDLGCGDGSHTLRFWDLAGPRAMVGLDAAPQAVKVGRSGRQDRRVEFVVGDAHRLPFADDSFDVLLLQGVLHHDDNAPAMLRESFRVARQILILEPNGYNLGLKVIEKTSRYHIEHGEKSYAPYRLARWVEGAGGRVVREEFAGLVPMFCPDWMARAAKAVEPVVEGLPLVSALGCAIYVMLAARSR